MPPSPDRGPDRPTTDDRVATEESARELVEEVEAELRRLSSAHARAHWEMATRGDDESRQRALTTKNRLRRFLSSRERYARITALLDSPALEEPLLRRQLELLAIEHRPNQIDPDVIGDLVARAQEIEAEFIGFRATLEGEEVSDNEIVEILRTERDPDRRKAAWEASKAIGRRVADRLLELVRRRNAAARDLGYRDFYAMRLETQEIDETELLETFDGLLRTTEAPFRAAKTEIDERVARRAGVSPEELRPWHYDDPFFQEPPLAHELGLDRYFRGRDLVSIAESFFRGIGLPIADVLARSDLYEREGKEQHAFCTDIDREGDVRVLCNLRDDERWMGTLLHELGHAAYDVYLPRELPWLLRKPAHIAVTEAVALFMDRLPYDIAWLEEAVGAAVPNRSEFARRASEAQRFGRLLMARWVPVMTRFERALYADPDAADLDALWWDLVEEHQLLRRPEGRRGPDWAAKIHLTGAPVYYHNYLLGDLIAAQFEEAVRSTLPGRDPTGWVGRRELGDFLEDRVFAVGAGEHWQALLERATGSRLSVDPFARTVSEAADR